MTKPARSPFLVASLTALLLALITGGVIFGLQLLRTAQATSAQVELDDSDRLGSISTFDIHRGSFTDNNFATANFRLINRSDSPFPVAITVVNGSPDFAATLTATLTTAGTQTTSGSLQEITLAPVIIPPRSTIPVRLELGNSEEAFHKYWQTRDNITVSVATIVEETT